MAAGISHYYHQARSGLMNINPKEAVELGEQWMIAGGTGLVLGAMSAASGGLDKKIFGMSVPLDGMVSIGLGVAGLALHSPEMCTASIAAFGSASTRTFETIFRKGMGAHGDFDGGDIPFSGDYPQLNAGGGFSGQFSGGFGFGAEPDRLIEAAKRL